MKRRHFLQGTAMAAVAAGAAPAVHAQTKSVRVGLAWINNAEYAGLWMAEENGFFKEERIEVKTLPGGPNAPPPARSQSPPVAPTSATPPGCLISTPSAAATISCWSPAPIRCFRLASSRCSASRFSRRPDIVGKKAIRN